MAYAILPGPVSQLSHQAHISCVQSRAQKVLPKFTEFCSHDRWVSYSQPWGAVLGIRQCSTSFLVKRHEGLKAEYKERTSQIIRDAELHRALLITTIIIATLVTTAGVLLHATQRTLCCAAGWVLRLLPHR